MGQRKREKPADVASAELAPPGGTSVGWTFWSTASICWRMWFLKYVMGLNPGKTQTYLTLGTCYHALLEGKTAAQIARWGPEYVLELPQAMELYKARIEKGPPLPKATAIEKELKIPTIPMTSKPDREEAGKVVRDFKTTSVRSKDDDFFWSVNGEIIGEMMAAGATTCVVDILNKNDGKTTQLEVTQTPAKIQALTELVNDVLEGLEARIHHGLDAGQTVGALFPKRMTSCVGKYGRCHYYDRCWSAGAARLLYKKSANNARWIPVLLDNSSQLARRGGLLPKDIEILATRGAQEGL